MVQSGALGVIILPEDVSVEGKNQTFFLPISEKLVTNFPRSCKICNQHQLSYVSQSHANVANSQKSISGSFSTAHVRGKRNMSNLITLCCQLTFKMQLIGWLKTYCTVNLCLYDLSLSCTMYSNNGCFKLSLFFISVEWTSSSLCQNQSDKLCNSRIRLLKNENGLTYCFLMIMYSSPCPFLCVRPQVNIVYRNVHHFCPCVGPKLLVIACLVTSCHTRYEPMRFNVIDVSPFFILPLLCVSVLLNMLKIFIVFFNHLSFHKTVINPRSGLITFMMDLCAFRSFTNTISQEFWLFHEMANSYLFVRSYWYILVLFPFRPVTQGLGWC